MMKLQKAVKRETVSVAVGTGIGCIAVIALFLILHLIFPESTVKVDYRVVLGALCGGAVAIANFFLMALTVQSVVNVENRDDALRMMRISYRNRMLMRGLWVIIAIVAPCFNYVAGIIPLFIPGVVIKIRGIRMGVAQMKTAAGNTSGAEPADASSETETDSQALPDQEEASGETEAFLETDSQTPSEKTEASVETDSQTLSEEADTSEKTE